MRRASSLRDAHYQSERCFVALDTRASQLDSPQPPLPTPPSLPYIAATVVTTVVQSPPASPVAISIHPTMLGRYVFRTWHAILTDFFPIRSNFTSVNNPSGWIGSCNTLQLCLRVNFFFLSPFLFLSSISVQRRIEFVCTNENFPGSIFRYFTSFVFRYGQLFIRSLHVESMERRIID